MRLLVRGAVRRVSFEVCDDLLATLGCSAHDLASRLSAAGFHVPLPLPACVKSTYGCDLMVRWGVDPRAACMWKHVATHAPDVSGQLFPIPPWWMLTTRPNANSFDACVPTAPEARTPSLRHKVVDAVQMLHRFTPAAARRVGSIKVSGDG